MRPRPLTNSRSARPPHRTPAPASAPSASRGLWPIALLCVALATAPAVIRHAVGDGAAGWQGVARRQVVFAAFALGCGLWFTRTGDLDDGIAQWTRAAAVALVSVLVLHWMGAVRAAPPFGAGVPAQLIAGVVAPAVTEELAFRGVALHAVQARLRRSLPAFDHAAAVAVVLSAAAFALAHRIPGSIHDWARVTAPLFVAGLLLGGVARRHGLLASMLLHALHNA